MRFAMSTEPARCVSSSDTFQPSGAPIVEAPWSQPASMSGSSATPRYFSVTAPNDVVQAESEPAASIVAPSGPESMRATSLPSGEEMIHSS